MPHKINPIDFENSEGNLGVHCRHAPLVPRCLGAVLRRPSAAIGFRTCSTAIPTATPTKHTWPTRSDQRVRR
jgi:hypothetical protein